MTVSLHHNCPNDLNGRNSRRWPHTAVSHNYFPHNKPRRHIVGRENAPHLSKARKRVTFIHVYKHFLFDKNVFWCFLKAKERIAVNGFPSHSYVRHLPYGITQCYLLPDTSERPPPP